MFDTAYLIPLLPLVGFVILVAFGRRLGEPRAGWVGFASAAASFLATLVIFLEMLTRDPEFRSVSKVLFPWIKVGSLDVDLALLVDPLSITMALFVTGVGALIHLYSVGYMRGDPRYHRFFLFLNLFLFSMLMLVLGDNLLVTFLGWEGVGASSYFLIGFWFERDSAATAAKKAFIVNRIGDVGLLLAMFVAFTATGTLTYLAEGTGLLEQAAGLSEGTVTAIGLLLFAGAIGKSAQLPLHVWLPDAMEGPTPVSALIHAATMVTAGVYLMARVSPFVELSSTVALTIAIVGAASALFAATVACAQDDIKRVLAWSTMSQLGYMFLAIGAGAYAVGLFHMITHAFFKALLFLGAGAVIHALHDEQSLKKMGGLRRYLPVTAGAFAIGWLAIAGIPPLSGFWSKDEVLLSVFEYNKALYGIALFTVLLTAFYMSRLFFLAFTGKARWNTSAVSTTKVEEPVAAAHGGHAGTPPHEAPRVMLVPIVVLALLTAAAGVLQVSWAPFDHVLEHFLEPSLVPHEGAHVTTNDKWVLAGVSVFMAVAGIVIARLVASASSPWPARLEPRVLARAWFIDPLYALLFVRLGGRVAALTAGPVERVVADGPVDATVRLVSGSGGLMRKLQTGYVRNYALGIAGGTALVLLWALVRSGA